MKFLRLGLIAVLSLGLSGCVVSEQKFAQYRTVIRARPELQAKMINPCVARMKSLNEEDRATIAAMVDLRPATVSQTFCRRMVQSFLSGRMTYQDYRDLMRGKPTPRLIRLMRGKA
jgi:hypothetical protein